MGLVAQQVTKSFDLEVTKKKIPNHESIPFFGVSEVIDATLKQLWNHPTLAREQLPLNAERILVKSDNVNDTILGTGVGAFLRFREIF